MDGLMKCTNRLGLMEQGIYGLGSFLSLDSESLLFFSRAFLDRCSTNSRRKAVYRLILYDDISFVHVKVQPFFLRSWNITRPIALLMFCFTSETVAIHRVKRHLIG